MVQLRHKASLELYSYAKEKMHLMPYNQNYNSLNLNFSIKCWQPRLILKQSSFFQMISQGCINALTASLDMIQYHRMLAWTPKWPPLILKRLISSIHSSTQSLHRVHSTYLIYPYLLQQFATSQYPSLMSKMH